MFLKRGLLEEEGGEPEDGKKRPEVGVGKTEKWPAGKLTVQPCGRRNLITALLCVL